MCTCLLISLKVFTVPVKESCLHCGLKISLTSMREHLTKYQKDRYICSFMYMLCNYISIILFDIVGIYHRSSSNGSSWVKMEERPEHHSGEQELYVDSALEDPLSLTTCEIRFLV